MARCGFLKEPLIDSLFDSAGLWELFVASITWSRSEAAGLASLLAAESILWDELLIVEVTKTEMVDRKP